VGVLCRLGGGDLRDGQVISLEVVWVYSAVWGEVICATAK